MLRLSDEAGLPATAGVPESVISSTLSLTPDVLVSILEFLERPSLVDLASAVFEPDNGQEIVSAATNALRRVNLRCPVTECPRHLAERADQDSKSPASAGDAAASGETPVASSECRERCGVWCASFLEPLLIQTLPTLRLSSSDPLLSFQLQVVLQPETSVVRPPKGSRARPKTVILGHTLAVMFLSPAQEQPATLVRLLNTTSDRSSRALTLFVWYFDAAKPKTWRVLCHLLALSRVDILYNRTTRPSPEQRSLSSEQSCGNAGKANSSGAG